MGKNGDFLMKNREEMAISIFMKYTIKSKVKKVNLKITGIN